MPLQAQQIVALACQAAKAPGYTNQAGQFLNAMLSDLAQQYDLEVARKLGTVNLVTGPAPTNGLAIGGAATNQGSGPYALPSDYLRMASNEVFYFVYGVPYVMVNCDLAEFDAMVQQAGISNYPENFATDDSAGLGLCTMMVWPPPGGSYIANIRYYSQPADISNPQGSATIPWFPHQTYLIKKLTANVMTITGDKRQSEYDRDADALLKGYLIMQKDDDGRAKTVGLDRRRFGSAFNRLPQTKLLGW